MTDMEAALGLPQLPLLDGGRRVRSCGALTIVDLRDCL